MKKAIFTVIGSILLALAAIAPASAATNESFQCSNGHVVNLEAMRSFEQGVGEVKRVSESGGVFVTNTCTDTGSVFTKMATDSIVLQNYIKLPGTNRYLNTRNMGDVFCNLGGYTTIFWKVGNGENFNSPSDGCATRTFIASQAK